MNDNEGIRGLSAQDGRVQAIVPDLAGSAMQYELDRQRKVVVRIPSAWPTSPGPPSATWTMKTASS